MKLNHRKVRITRWAAASAVAFVMAIAAVAGGLAGPAVAQDGDPEEILAELQTQLKLSDEQTQQVGAAMGKMSKELESTLAKHENAEEPDAAAMIGDVKKVRDDYRKELQKILSKEQYEGYLAMVDAVMTEMMTDVAEIRLMDIQPKCTLTDEQVEQLAPIMGKGMLDMVRLLFENADKKLTMPKKVKLGKAVKSIQSDMDKQINAVLTEEQQKKYAEYKEAQKG
jgi:Spy/CpxP family protein refolding chaperone